MEIDSTYYRYTDCDVPLNLGSYVDYIDGEWVLQSGDAEVYQPRKFVVESIRYSIADIVDQMKIDIDDMDYALAPVFIGGTPEGEAIKLQNVVLNPDNHIIGGAMLYFEGEIDGWNRDEVKLSVIATNLFSQWAQKTTARHSASCRWKAFKGTECGYSGDAAWCDRTYGKCGELANTANFGGFRFLPDLVGKQIWWGGTQY